MFTGIIEEIGEIVSFRKEGENIHFTIKANISKGLKIDQSVAHDGVCLTVVDFDNEKYTVTAINETLKRSNLNYLDIGSRVNLERSMKIGGRIDGHIVQGHVDQTATCILINQQEGSHVFTFRYKDSSDITVQKGSVCVNGVSLTIVDSAENTFSVAVIPYTFDNTNFHAIKEGSIVNIEFDILGKYMTKILKKNL